MSYELEGRLNELADRFDEEWAAAKDVEAIPRSTGQGETAGMNSQSGGGGYAAGDAPGTTGGWEGQLINPDLDREVERANSPEVSPQSHSDVAESFISRVESKLHDTLDTVESLGRALVSAVRNLFQAERSPAVGMSASALIEVAQRAYELHPDFCNYSVIHAANAYGIHDLDGQRATQQIETMDANWKEVSASAAQSLANQGVFVVAGYRGHVAIVTPGEMRQHGGELYPMVTGGGSAAGRSNGTRSVGDVWRRDVRDEVRYFTPK